MTPQSKKAEGALCNMCIENYVVYILLYPVPPSIWSYIDFQGGCTYLMLASVGTTSPPFRVYADFRPRGSASYTWIENVYIEWGGFFAKFSRGICAIQVPTQAKTTILNIGTFLDSVLYMATEMVNVFENITTLLCLGILIKNTYHIGSIYIFNLFSNQLQS